MLATLLLAAEEVAEKSHTPFYIFAAALVVFALGLSALGVARHETFPPSKAAGRALSLLAVVLVAGAMFTAVITG